MSPEWLSGIAAVVQAVAVVTSAVWWIRSQVRPPVRVSLSMGSWIPRGESENILVLRVVSGGIRKRIVVDQLSLSVSGAPITRSDARRTGAKMTRRGARFSIEDFSELSRCHSVKLPVVLMDGDKCERIMRGSEIRQGLLDAGVPGDFSVPLRAVCKDTMGHRYQSSISRHTPTDLMD